MEGKLLEGAGFTLMEMLVVLVIVALLALAATNAISSGEAEVRAQTFRVRADLQLARMEAIRRSQEVLVDLVLAGESDDDGISSISGGYKICLDLDGDDNCDSADTILRETALQAPAAYYDANLPSPIGPHRTVDGDPWPAGQDGVSFSGNRFVMQPDGTSNKAGTVYLFTPGGRQGIGGGPLAVVLNRVGRIRVSRWRPELHAWEK